MTAPGFRLLFAGTPAFAATALTRMLSAGFRPGAVLTQPDRPAGRGLGLRASPVKELAAQHGLPMLQPEQLKTAEAQATLFSYPADVMVVAAYGLILPQAVLDFPRLGCVNIHASLLPRWRGAAPIHRALLAGDGMTGISIMQMDTGLDTGPVLLQEDVPIAPNDTSGTLHDRLAQCGAEQIVEALRRLRDGPPLVPHPQPTEGVTYAHKIEASEAAIDWSKSAEEIDRQVRAFNPHPGARTRLRGLGVKIWSAALVMGAEGPGGIVLEVEKTGILVACNRGALRITELQRAGAKRMGAQAFLAGCPLSPGDRFDSPAT